MGDAHARVRWAAETRDHDMTYMAPAELCRGLKAALALTFPPVLRHTRPNSSREIKPAPGEQNGESNIVEGKAREQRGHRLLLCHQEELAHADGKAGDEEIRSGGA